MDDFRNAASFASRLLQQDTAMTDSQHKDYRCKLEQALAAAERHESLTYWVCCVSFVLSVVLMFVGGSHVIGDFDPWSADATVLSVAAGVIYLVATVLFVLSLASYYSRFRPKAREGRERLRDESILDLQHQIRELREQIRALAPQAGSASDHPHSA